jgi:hypothetical protein
MTVVVYMVIIPDGVLAVREAAGKVSVDEWGRPYQHALWAAVHSRSTRTATRSTVCRSLGACAPRSRNAADQFPQVYPPTPVPSAGLTSLGCAPVGPTDEQRVDLAGTLDEPVGAVRGQDHPDQGWLREPDGVGAGRLS